MKVKGVAISLHTEPINALHFSYKNNRGKFHSKICLPKQLLQDIFLVEKTCGILHFFTLIRCLLLSGFTVARKNQHQCE